MTASRDPEALIAAFFETRQPDMPDRTFDEIRREVHRTRQRVVIGPVLVPVSSFPARWGVAAAIVLAVGIVVLSTRPSAVPGGLSTPSPSISPSPSAVHPTAFTSRLYDYTVTIPTGWIAAPAVLRWDGRKQPGPDAETDKFAGPDGIAAWAFAGPFTGDLQALAADRIAANARDHADTCPVPQPEVNRPIRIGDQAGILLGWNCGALVDQALALRNGTAYAFTFRDLGVRAATDASDLALFQSLLESVRLPN